MTLVLNGSTGVSAVDGSASTPAIQGNDTDTGVFFPAANTVGISTNGTEQMRVDSSGNVGIGTGSPISKLSVAGSATAPSSVDTLSIYNLQDGGAGIGFVNATTSAANPLGSIRALVEGTGAGTNDGVLQFGTALNGVSFERARIDSMGNMGLGVTPQAWDSNYKVLQVNSYGAAFGATTAGAVQVSMSSNAYYASGSWKGILTGSNASLYRQEGGAHYWSYATSVTSGTNFSFTEAMRIDTSGNVGIGTTPSTAKLQISSGAADMVCRLEGTGSPYLAIYRSGTREAYLQATSSVNALWVETNKPLVFATNNAERARIDTSGNFFIGQSSAVWGERVLSRTTDSQPLYGAYSTSSSYTNNIFICQVETAASFSWRHFSGRAAGGSEQVVIYGNGNIQNTNGSYGAISDVSIKENVIDATPKLNGLCQVRVVNFNLKNDTQKQIGVIAQELEEVFPGLVHEDQETGLKGVKYSVFVPMLIKALQELNAKVEGLQAEINALKGAA